MSSADRLVVPLKSMCSTKWAMPACSVRLVTRAARQPHADRDRSDVRHRFGHETKTVREGLAADAGLGQGCWWERCRNSLQLKGLKGDDIMGRSWVQAPLRDKVGRPGRTGAGRARSALRKPRGYPRFHARQVFRWIWKRGVTDFALMTDLSRSLRAKLADEFVHQHAGDRPARRVRGRHAEVRPPPRRRQADRVGLHPRHARRRRSASRRRSDARWAAHSA